MEPVITQEHIDAARKAGACGDGLRRYKVGTPLSSISREHLEWVETALPNVASIACDEVSKSLTRGRVALSVLGYGSGDGSGDGYGYGDGSGYGDGYGYGSGYGYSDGYGSGAQDIVAA